MNKLVLKRNIITSILYICSAMFMNGFLKFLVAFVANEYQDKILMVTILVSYLFPVLCFLVYFYNYYIKKISKVFSVIYSISVILISIIILILISINLRVYISNNLFGVYDSIPSIFVHFPYDAIIIYFILIMVQIYHLMVIFNSQNKHAYLKEQHYNIGYTKLNIFEFLIFSVLAFFALYSVGNFIGGLSAIKNAVYNFKYVYLLLWFLIIPTMNLLSFVFKFENKIKPMPVRLVYLIGLILVNVLFGILLFIFEKSDPNFVVSIGKPLFPLTFALSSPIEIKTLLIIQGVSIIINFVKLIIIIVKNSFKKININDKQKK